MKCRKCRGDIPDGSRFCMLCGVVQDIQRRPKSRGNGPLWEAQRPMPGVTGS